MRRSIARTVQCPLIQDRFSPSATYFPIVCPCECHVLPVRMVCVRACMRACVLLFCFVACSNVLVFKGHVSAFSVADLYSIIDNFCFEPHPRTGVTVPNLKTLELISVYVRTLDSRVFLGPSRTFCSERTTQFANLKFSTLRHIANVTAVYACLHYHAAWHCCA